MKGIILVSKHLLAILNEFLSYLALKSCCSVLITIVIKSLCFILFKVLHTFLHGVILQVLALWRIFLIYLQ